MNFFKGSLLIVFVAFFTIVYIFPNSVNAVGFQDAATKLNQSAKQADYKPVPSGKKPEQILALRIGAIVNFILQVVGSIAVLFVVYGGFQWVTAGGNTDKVSQAKKTVINAVLGCLAITLAYALVALGLTFTQS